MNVLALIGAAVLAGPSYYVGLRLGRRWRGRRGRYLGVSAVLIGAAALSVLFLSPPQVILLFGVVFGVELGMRHAFGPLSGLLAGVAESASSDVAETTEDGIDKAESRVGDTDGAVLGIPESGAEAAPEGATSA